MAEVNELWIKLKYAVIGDDAITTSLQDLRKNMRDASLDIAKNRVAIEGLTNANR